MANDAKEFIYVLHCPETGLRKIGTTVNVRQRMAQLQAGSAYPLDIGNAIILVCPAETGRLFESHLHEKFRHKRTHGEWFKLDDEDMKHFDAHVVARIELYHTECAKTIAQRLGLETLSYEEWMAIPEDQLTERERSCRILIDTVGDTRPV